MPSLIKNPPIFFTLLAAGVLPVCNAVEVDSNTHPLLKRALGERPDLDRDANGVLSLDEYRGVDPKPPGLVPIQEGALPFLPVLPSGEVVIADFEDNNYRNAPGWTSEGSAFPGDLHAAARLIKRRVGPYHGKVFLTTFSRSGQETGRLLSPEFALELDFLTATMSGGKFPRRLGVNLWIGEELVRSATGNNDDYFQEVAFDVREFRGRLAKLEVLDLQRGLWGHLNLDRLVMTNNPGRAVLIDARPAPVSPLEGLALTTDGPKRGSLTVEDGQLQSAHHSLRADSLLLTLNPRQPNPEARTGALHLIDGEVWPAQIRNLEGQELSIHTRLFGDRKVPLARISCIDLQSSSPGAPRSPGHLYRVGGEPIPGKLVWIREKDIAVDCALGVIPIPRASVQRFAIANPQAAPDTTDTIGLMDGSLLFGKTSFDGPHLLVAHELLGELRLDWSTVRSLRRYVPGVDWLEKLTMTVLEQVGPALPPPAPQWHDGRDDHYLRAIRIMPNTVVRFALKTGPARSGHFRGELTTVPGNRASLKVAILADTVPIWEQKLAAGSAPVPLSLDLSDAKELTIKVEFDGPLAFPCGIDLRDPHVLNLAQIRSQSNQPN